MMRRLTTVLRRLWPLALGGAAVLSLGLAAHPTPARADATNGICIPSTLSYAPTWYPQCDASGNLKVTGTFTPSGTQNVNITQFGGNAVVTGTGASGAGIPRVTVSNDSTVGLIAGSQIIGKVGIDQTTPGTTNLVYAKSCSDGSTTTCATVAANNGNFGAGNNSLFTLGFGYFWDGSNWDRAPADSGTGVLQTTIGGSGYVSIPSGASNTVVKGSAGRLVALIVTTAGTSATTCYDNPSTNSGNVLFTTPTAPAAGTIYQLNIIATTGITCRGAVSSAVFNATYY